MSTESPIKDSYPWPISHPDFHSPKYAQHGFLIELRTRRPYALTEFAAAGAWMTPRTAWGSAVEPTSTQKLDASSEGREPGGLEAFFGLRRCPPGWAIRYIWMGRLPPLISKNAVQLRKEGMEPLGRLVLEWIRITLEERAA